MPATLHPRSALFTSAPEPWVEHAENAEFVWHDVVAPFNLALRLKITGNTNFADSTSNILHARAITLAVIDGGDDKYLTACLQGYELANAAELLRDYSANIAVTTLLKLPS